MKENDKNSCSAARPFQSSYVFAKYYSSSGLSYIAVCGMVFEKSQIIYSMKYSNIFYTVYRTSRTVLNRSNPFGGKTWNRSEPFLFILLQIGNSSRTVLNRSEPFLSLLARRTVLNRSPGLRLLHTRTVLNRSDKAYFSTYLSIHT